MFDVLDRGYIRTKIWISNVKEDFKSDERGVSGIVATILLVLIAILLAAIFWKQIQKVVTDLFKKVSGASKGVPNKSEW